MFERECFKASGGTQKSIVIALFLVVFVISTGSYAVPVKSPAVRVGEVVRYDDSFYTVKNVNTAKKAVTLCPYHDYSHYFNYSGWGWFYGQKCITVPLETLVPERERGSAGGRKKESVAELLRKATNPGYLNNLTAKQFRELYRKITALAVMHPTPQKVKAYVYMTNFLRLKSLVFAHAVNDYYLRNSRYYILKRIGETSWSIRAAWAKQKEEGEKILSEHRRNIGLAVFIRNGCAFCEKEIPALEWLHLDYGVDVLLISMNSCPKKAFLPCMVNPAAFKAFHVQSIPTMVLVIKTKNGKPVFYPVGVGLTDEATLFNRMVYYVKGYYGEDLYSDRNFLMLLKEGK